MINVQDHIGLARKIAWEYYACLRDKYTYDEIESAALLGLTKASRKFEESKGTKFSCYAAMAIKNEIRTMIRSDKWYYERNGVSYRVFSLNTQVGTETSRSEIQDLIEDSENIEESIINNISINEALSVLTQREKRIIYLHFYKNLSQKDISKVVNLSQPQVSKIIRNSLSKMRKELNKGMLVSA
jgi:RNA polymerase sporulation-specific sigma factor